LCQSGSSTTQHFASKTLQSLDDDLLTAGMHYAVVPGTDSGTLTFGSNFGVGNGNSGNDDGIGNGNNVDIGERL